MLLEQYISPHPHAKVLVLFGGNPLRRDQVIRHLKVIPELSIIGTLSEAEGLQTLQQLPRVDIVLIGGRYENDQRQRIRAFIRAHLPNVKVTEPGVDYPYEENLIKQQVEQFMQ
jgi:hypothetical protein